MSDRSFFSYRGWEATQPGFCDRALSELASHHVGIFSLEEAQLYAWREELRSLEAIARKHPSCTIALEYMIPRMGKRVDAVLLVEDHILVVEYKVGETHYTSEALNQVSDYAFDLKNFHGDSHNRPLFPIVVCTDAPTMEFVVSRPQEGIHPTQRANFKSFPNIVESCLKLPIYGGALDHAAWLSAPYQPTPTIVEAAQALYEHNTVEDISRNEAGTTNIMRTTAAINRIIEHSRSNNRKSICFLTGVPGAGKTLVGLNLASTRRSKTERPGDEAAVFLSGNGPLIEVLQASLVEDQLARNEEERRACLTAGLKPGNSIFPRKKTMPEVTREVKTFVQAVHLFRDDLFKTDGPPSEHVAIFDEAQRAWTEEQLSFKMKTRWQNKREVHKSEPQCLIEYMNRHDDWACMVCLVGGGQEINQGEAGIVEWFKALRSHFPDWDIYASHDIQGENYLGKLSFSQLAPRVTFMDDLHLSVDMRSFRNKNVAAFAEALVSNRPDDARCLYHSIVNDYPIYVTRDLARAKDWVRESTKRPSDRYGVVADSYGQRIRADGITVPMDFDAVKWFLRGKDEVDSSYFMEIAASEFKIQGLEIDYAIVAWEGEYRYADGGFEYHRFIGGKWQNVKSDMLRRYLKNGYRVLLTRARQGYVIYVPNGSQYDPTRPPEYYDGTYDYLLSAGIKPLPTEGA